MNDPISLNEPSTSASMLDRARQGDTDSWKQIAQLYGPIVYGWARRCGCQSADAADVMQDTFAAVAKSLVRFDHTREGATFRGWLWTISRNKIRDLIRHAEHDRAFGGEQGEIALAQIAVATTDASDPPTSAHADAADLRRRMIELLRRNFDERTWRMFWETAIAGRVPADVADEMGVSKWAVYKARARVLQRLQQELGGLE